MTAPLPQTSGGPSPANPELQRLERERLDELASELGTEGLAWLAVVPTWTHEIARTMHFPTGSRPLTDWLQLAEDAALVEQEPERRADKKLGREFWIADADRSRVLDFLKSPDSLGDHGLRRVTATIAKGMQFNDTGPELPVALQHWAALASSAERPDAAALQLESQVEQLTRDRRLGEARATVTAGGALARILGGPLLGDAVDLGNRRLEVAYREVGDERHLRRYFRRDAQERAFEALLEEDSPAWALHYLGMGGIGKTMLLRRITSQIAKEKRLPVSRIDFDHLSPDYPVRRPGQLLMALAMELRPYVGSASQRLVVYLSDTAKELHELLGAEPPPDDPLWNVTRPEFGKLLGIFADLLRDLPPVVLLLDTCEELARVPVVNKILPAVEATFSILQHVHDEIPSVRVVLAGRRPLASSGHGWSLGQLEAGASWDKSHGLRPYLLARPFLTLHEILGFTDDEAHHFLTGSWGLPLERHGALERAVLDRSVETGRAVAIVRPLTEAATPDDRSTGRAASNEPLYSPFDLSLYASWLTDDPSLGPEQIATTDGDPYVDVRIVQRIQPMVLRSALPAIVALGRIDERTLAEALPPGLTAEAVSDLYRALADHEWMEQQRDPHTGQLFLEVEPHLLPRLRKYYEHELRAPAADAARRRVVPGLERTIRTSTLGELSVHQIDAAMALLPAAAAADLWTEVLVRVPLEADWNWLRNVTERLLGTDGALSRQPLLAAGLSAASTSLQLHLAGALRAPSDMEVVAMVAHWPDEDTRPWIARLHQVWSIDSGMPAGLAARQLTALLQGFVAAPAVESDDPRHATRLRSEAEAGALVYVVEDRADRIFLAESDDVGRRELLAEALTAWAGVLAAHEYPLTLVAMAEILGARVNVAAGSADEAARLVDRALERVNADRADDDPPWLFWRRPESVVDRVRLEALTLHRDHLVGPAPDPLRWLVGRGALSRAATIDGERLASALEQWWLDRALPERSELGISEAADVYSVQRQPTAAIHRQTPPLFVTLARKRAALGDFAGADKRLRERAHEAESSREDAETVRVATIARLEIARASRDVPADLPAAVGGLDAGLRERSDARPAFALRALTGVDLTAGFVPTPHDAWATLGSDARRHAREWALSADDTGAGALDIVEAFTLMGGAVPDRTLRVRAEHLAEGFLRALLRTYAIGPSRVLLSNTVDVGEPIATGLAVSNRGVETHAGPTSQPVPAPEARALQPVNLLDAANELAEYLALRGDQAAAPAVTGPAPVAGPARLLHIVGARRLAAVAQDEGELLALRLPEQGARLLDLAAKLASYARDDGAFLDAEITGGLALARLGREAEAARNARVREAWTRITGEAPPSLEAVGQWWSDRRDISSAHDRLSGRRVRHAILVALGTDPEATQHLRESTAEWVPSFIGAAARTPELAFLAARAESGSLAPKTGAAQSAADSEAPPAPATGAHASTLDQLLAVAVVLVSVAWSLILVGTGALVFPYSSRVGGEPGLGVVVLATGGASLAMVLLAMWRPRLREMAIGGATLIVGFSLYYATIGALADWILSRPLGRWQRFGLAFGLLAAIGATPSAYRRVWSWWQSRVARRSRLTIRVEASALPNLRTVGTTPSPATVTFALTRVRTAGWRLSVREPMLEQATVVELPSVVRGSYAEAAGPIDRKALADVAAIRADLGGAEWTVPVLVDRADQLPWEALLSHALAGDDTPDDSVFFYRSLPGGRWPGTLAQATVAVEGWSPDAGQVWRKAGRIVEIGASDRSLVVHAVGTPVLGSTGPQFRLASARRASSADAGFEAASEGPSSLSSLSELPVALSLLVLQQEPAFSGARLGSDREQAALLRVLASALFQRGHQAVITIPSIEPELADLVLKAIVNRLSGKASLLRLFAAKEDFSSAPREAPEDFLRLVHAVRDARSTVSTWLAKHGNAVEGALDDRVEAAWDICLFARYPEGSVIDSATRRTS